MGLAPIGYQNKVYENGRKYITPKPQEAGIISWAFEMLATGSCSVLEIYRMTKAKGLKCSKNNFWHLISNPVYMGKIIVPKYQQEEAHLVQGTHEPIISEELFYTVQDVLCGRKKPKTVKQAVHEEFPLRNFLVCPKCGRLITASRSKGRTQYYNYYHCLSSCGWRYKAEHVNEALVQELRKYKPTLAMISLYKQVILDVYHQVYVGKQGQKKELLQQINEQNSRLAKARELLLVDALDAVDYKAIKVECERKINLLEAKLASTTTPQQQEDDIEKYLDKALYNLAYIDTRYQEADIKSKRQILGSIFVEKLQFSENGYRTTKVNEAVTMICTLEAALKGCKKGQTSDFASLSKEVIPLGLEPRAHTLKVYCSTN